MLRIVVAVLFSVSLAACSVIPDVEYRYYPSKSNSSLTITQTIACNKDQNQFVVVTTPTLTSSYSADYDSGPFKIKVRNFEGGVSSLADSDASFTFFDDGRLKSINQSTTGQGETVIKSAVTLATTISAFAAGLDAASPIPTLKDECAAIAAPQPTAKSTDAQPASGAVTFTYQYQFTDGILGGAPGKPIFATISPASQNLFDTIFKNGKAASKVRPLIKIGALDDTRGRVKSTHPCGASDADVVDLELKNTGSARIDVLMNDGSDKYNSVWNSSITLPRPGTYCLPIPRSALFGKQNFSLTLTEAGAIAAVDYGKTSGAAGALNAANSIATAVAPETPAAKAADLKAQADIIAQHQRLARCQANPATCI